MSLKVISMVIFDVVDAEIEVPVSHDGPCIEVKIEHSVPDCSDCESWHVIDHVSCVDAPTDGHCSKCCLVRGREFLEDVGVDC
eukprot:3444876-Heterocapsa_arctica.AAC.1